MRFGRPFRKEGESSIRHSVRGADKASGVMTRLRHLEPRPQRVKTTTIPAPSNGRTPMTPAPNSPDAAVKTPQSPTRCFWVTETILIRLTR
jgi:hypothetical protein